MRTDTSRAAVAPAHTSSESFLPMSCARPPIGRPARHLLPRVGCSPAEARSSRRHRCPSPRHAAPRIRAGDPRPRRLSVRPLAAAHGQAMATRSRRPDALRRSGRLPAAPRGDRRVSGRRARRAMPRRPDRRGRVLATGARPGGAAARRRGRCRLDGGPGLPGCAWSLHRRGRAADSGPGGRRGPRRRAGRRAREGCTSRLRDAVASVPAERDDEPAHAPARRESRPE